jgi:ribosome modulation factor
MRTEPEETETNAENLERENKIARAPQRNVRRYAGETAGRSKEMNPYQTMQEIKDRARIEFAPPLLTGR